MLKTKCCYRFSNEELFSLNAASHKWHCNVSNLIK